MTVVDCLVLSGGGAKGAYGAGVAKAIAVYRGLKKIQSSVCYIGTSAGALNAAVLAAADADALIGFWTSVTPHKILGARIRSPRFQGALHFLTRRRFFSIYDNRGLRKLIGESVQLVPMLQRDSHLIIAATNYTRGTLEAFYVSPLIQQFVSVDAARPVEQQRIQHFRTIGTQADLEKSLLASAAIPIFFPPVDVNGDWYIDGGIGNHTPTREAAYFLRYLAHTGLGQPGDVFCVKQDPPRNIKDKEATLPATDVLKRTLEIYHHVHTEPIVRAWSRINDEVRDHAQRIGAFLQWLSTQGISQSLQASIAQQLQQQLGTLGRATARQDLGQLVEIEPSTELGDTLDFEAVRIRKTIERGYLDMLIILKNIHRLNPAEYQMLVDVKLFGT
jgi:hypothetical protein